MITDVYFPRINGVSTSIETFRSEMIELGHQVVLMAPEYPASLNDDEDIIRIPSRYLMFDKEDRMLKPAAALQLVDKLRQHDFDIIHIQTPFIAHYLGIKFSRELKLPVIETYHTYFEEYLFHYVPFLPKSVLRFLARRFTAKQCNHVDHVIVPSSAMHAKLQNYKVKTDISVLPTGLRADRFRQLDPSVFMDAYGIDSTRPRLVHVGRIAHEKNIDFLIDVLLEVKAEIPDVLMIIAGEGPALKYIKAYAHDQGLDNNIKFVGYLDRKNLLLCCYRSAQAFVFSSKTETQGLVLLESMAQGVPVVSTAFMGTRDILESERGALVAEDDVYHFAAQVVEILKNRDLQATLANEACKYAGEWNSTTMAIRQLDLYLAVIDSHQYASKLVSDPA